MTEKRDFGDGENSGERRENSGQIHIRKSHFADEERLLGMKRDFEYKERIRGNRKTKQGLKAWIPASAGMTEKRDFGE